VSSRLKALVQYTVIFAITFLLIWFSLRGLQGENKLDYLKHTWNSAHKGWLLAMAGISILSHLLRAERWRMLMAPAGHQPKLSHSFYSLMVGYLVNLVIPRGGELSRCYNLYKLDKTPVDMSFGTVVVERIIDMLCLLILIGISFAVESEKLFSFINTLPIGTSGENSSRINLLLYIGIGCIVLAIVLFLYLRQNQKVRGFISKTWKGFKQGLSSVFQLKNKSLFLTYSVLIWVLYFLTSYTVLKAFPSTSELGFGAVLSLFAIGSIAMAAPLPGGTGSYHVLVPQGLVFLYSIPQTEAVAFTFIFHGWQTAIMILCGAISLLITSYIVRKKDTSSAQ
jgi:uncharacterized protein (TIRG00374 family)